MKLGLFSVSYAGLWGQARLSVEEFIARAAALGFQGVLLMAKRPHASPLDLDKARLRKIKAALASRAVECFGLACYNDILLAGPAEVPVREMQLLYIERCAALCAELGGTLLRVFTAYAPARPSAEDAWGAVAAFLREAGEKAARYGVRLAVQNHHDLAVDTAAMAQLLDDVGSPNVRAGYDAWSPFLRGEDLQRGARLMAGRAILTIAANYRVFPRYSYVPEQVNYRREQPDVVRACSMQDGAIDYRSFFKGLAEGGYDGPVVYEMCSPVEGGPSPENLDAKASAFLAYMKEALG